MSEQKLHNGELFDAAATAESESVAWVSLRLKQAVRAIGAERAETMLSDLFIMRFKRMQRRRRIQRISVGLASGPGLGLGADAMFDFGWLDSLLNWVGRPLLLRLGDSLSVVAGWVA